MRRHLPVGLLGAALAACGADDRIPDLVRGRQQYSMYCAGCHGADGDGQGPAARFMSPRPRDLRRGRVKFAAVVANSLPRDEDLLTVIDRGLSGTSMPSWSMLSHEDKRAILAHLKTFSPVWQREAPGKPVVIQPDPWRGKPERGIAAGERVYHGTAACWSCHPAYAARPVVAEHTRAAGIALTGFREDLYDPVEKDSDWGMPIKPPDFLADRPKLAGTREELVRVIAAGVGGTAMPSWADSLNAEELWGVASYVEWLTRMRNTEEGASLRRSLLTQPPFQPWNPSR